MRANNPMTPEAEKIDLRQDALAELDKGSLSLARIEEDAENWETAKELYLDMLENMTDHTIAAPPQQRLMTYMRLSRCAYHLQKYDRALEAGAAAVKTNRSFPYCHKHIALSQKGNGRYGGCQSDNG